MTPEQLEKRLRRAEKNICCLNNTIEVTLLQAQNLVTADNLKAGRTYLITDKNLYLPAITTNSFGDGIRVMMCPNFYSVDFTDIYGNYWRGGFYSTNTYTAGDLTIWGGKVWRNLTGNAGNNVDYGTLDSEWELIDPLTFSNHEYTELTFGVRYDINNDWVEKQWDNRGNEFGISFVQNQDDFNFNYNPCDISDWNLGSFHAFYNNKNVGIFNNAFTNQAVIRYNININQFISSNLFSGSVFNNTNNGRISNNTAQDIQNNSNEGAILGNDVGTIQYNSNGGDISNNISTGETIEHNSNLGSIQGNGTYNAISWNNNNGNINSNTNTGQIFYNSNNGHIEGNVNDGDIRLNNNTGSISNNSNSDEIKQNSNAGYINDNTNGNNISYNTNAGNIELNSNSLEIINNSCTGDILSNSNNGKIINNSNNGNIYGNFNDGPISNNSNGGTIEGNANAGYINNNTNSGNISGNSNAGFIIYNSNNGSILGLGGIVTDIYNNINNGNIITSGFGPITDTVVNK